MPAENRAAEKMMPIAVVDDDESVREATANLLRSSGYDADVFASAEEFLKSRHAFARPCLILDVHLPEMDGLKLQSRLENRVPIVFITAYFDARTRSRALRAGAIAFLHKPYSEEELLGTIREAVRPKHNDDRTS
jgi:FixJ family two-component response regulator